jgi:hypothetical protein
VTFDIDSSRKSYGSRFFSGSLAFLVPIRTIGPFIFFVALSTRGSRRLLGAIWQVGSRGSYGSHRRYWLAFLYGPLYRIGSFALFDAYIRNGSRDAHGPPRSRWPILILWSPRSARFAPAVWSPLSIGSI